MWAEAHYSTLCCCTAYMYVRTASAHCKDPLLSGCCLTDRRIHIHMHQPTAGTVAQPASAPAVTDMLS